MYEEKRKINIKRQIAGAQSHRVGAYFEGMIEASLRSYREEGLAYIEKTPEPMKPIRPNGAGKFIACYTKQGQPDFKGTLKGGRSIVIEAKHTNDNKISINRLTDEQVNALETHYQLGALVFVLVSFNLEAFYMIDWGVWRDIPRIYGRKHIKRADVPQYEIKAINGHLMILDGVEKSNEQT